MKPLFDEKDLKIRKSRDILPLECKFCSKCFYKTKHSIQDALNPNQTKTLDFCSITCANKQKILDKNLTFKREYSCTVCSKTFFRSATQRNKSKNIFCSHSCAAIYNNIHKTKGTRRSKLEIFLEEKITNQFPNLEIHFNRKDAINSELDIYIPSLKLAFELNGIFHYEPIYGSDKLSYIQNNDNRKFQACLENGIELCIIDVSSQKYFKEKTALKFFNIINTVIENKKFSVLIGF